MDELSLCCPDPLSNHISRLIDGEDGCPCPCSMSLKDRTDQQVQIRRDAEPSVLGTSSS